MSTLPHTIGCSLSILTDTVVLLSCLQDLCEHLDVDSFLGIAGSALTFSAELPRTDFDEIRDEIRKALHVVTAHIGTDSVIEEVASRDLHWWRVAWLLDRIKEVANLDARLLTQDLITNFTKCASRCPDDRSDVMKERLDYLRERLRRNSYPCVLQQYLEHCY